MKNFHKLFEILGTDKIVVNKEDGSCLTFSFEDKSFMVPNSTRNDEPIDPITYLTNAFEFHQLTTSKYIEFLKNSVLKPQSSFPSFQDLAVAKVILVSKPTFVHYYISEPIIETKGRQVNTYRFSSYSDIILSNFETILSIHHDNTGYQIRGTLK